ncbi:unnamed protein product, partial [Effrenium voratum]
MPVLLRGKPQEPSSFVRTTAKVSFQEPLPPDATWDTAMARADEFSFRVPASVAWPSATPSRRSRPSLEALARRGEAAVGGAGPQDVANVAWACARLAPSGAAPAGALGQAFHEQQLKLREPANSARAPAASSASGASFWSAAAARGAAAAASPEAASAPVADLENLVSSLCLVGHDGDGEDFARLLEAVAAALQQRAGRLDGHGLPEVEADVVTSRDPEKPAVLLSRNRLSALWKPPGWCASVGRDDLDVDAERPEVPTTGQLQVHHWIMERFGSYPISLDPKVSHGLLHRLDVGTSGVLLWASSYGSYYAARLCFAQRRVRKEYLCLCRGLLGPQRIDLPLAEPDEQRRRAEVSELGRPSSTVVEGAFHFASDSVAAPGSESDPSSQPEEGLVSLARVRLLTGRQHQIRAHLAHLEHPLEGDLVYGGNPGPRVFLHAARLQLEDFSAASPLPPDLARRLRALRALDPPARAALRKADRAGGGGNKKLADVGPWFRDKIVERFKQVKLPLTVKYIDPTYMIRAIPPNANDSVYCSMLSHNAVHAAMAGYTGITVGQVNSRHVMLPIACVTKNPQKKVDLSSQRFQELVSCTLQPDFAPDGWEEAGNPLAEWSDPVDAIQALGAGSEVRRLELEHLAMKFGERDLPTTLMDQVKGGKVFFFGKDSWAWGPETGSGLFPAVRFLSCLAEVTQTLGLPGVRLQMQQAGPRRSLFFKPGPEKAIQLSTVVHIFPRPAEVAATIVTCGGLCPGLNSVIRELVMMLYAYGVKKVYGIKGGFKGVVNPQSWITLTPENVKDIHLQGGSILVSDRGNPPHLEMAKALKKRGVRQHFVLGGDGTQKGAYQTYEQMQIIGWECAVVGIPKTIDNDINLLDRSFGFDTAMSEALKAIETAYVEATCNANAVGLVKLMGRPSGGSYREIWGFGGWGEAKHCGYLTMMSVLAARKVDICLLPEMDINLDKAEEVLDHCVELVSTSGYAVVVVAEGCGETMLHSSGAMDEGGNKKINDVGPWLKDAITDHFKNLKTLGAPYTGIYCSELAQAAVHAAMAGYTGLTVGKVDQHAARLTAVRRGRENGLGDASSHVPDAETSMPSRIVDVNGRWFEALRTTTQQPNLEFTGKATAKPLDPSKPVLRSHRGLRKLNSIGDVDAADTLRVPETKLQILDGFGNIKKERQLARDDLIQDSVHIRSLQCFHLSHAAEDVGLLPRGERYGQFNLPSTLKGVRLFSDNFSWTSQAMFLGDRVDSGKGAPYFKMTRAGPRETLHFDPHDPASSAAIISCGGICPGLNCVIREVVNTLWAYGVRRVYGIKGGYKGVMEPETWLELTPEIVKDIHTEGGTMLISDRGNPPHIEMAKMLQSKNVRQYFVLGGDGTHKGAMETFNGMMEIDHECAVVGVPKTIDNDVPMIDQTFGFDTACTEAAKAVNTAYVEAKGNANCIGLVKLMGRHCGFIAMNAALAA